MRPGKLPWPSLLALPAAFFFLSVLLNLDSPAGPLFTRRLLLPSIDVWLLLLPATPGLLFSRERLSHRLG